MAEIKNFSRHDFSADQIAALEEVFPGYKLGEAENVFFKGPEDLSGHVSGEVASLVAPWDMILEALSRGLIAPGTTLIAWSADQAARKRGAHAARGMKAFRYDGGWSIVAEMVIEPTVEVDFKTGEVSSYQGE